MDETPPEELPERKLFEEYIQITNELSDGSGEFKRVNLEERRSDLLTEVGERLEILEAIKSLTSSNIEDKDLREEITIRE